MRTLILFVLAAIWQSQGFIELTLPCQADEKPNVVIVITDDQGYGDLSFHGNKTLPTRHLDQLAKQSLRMTDYHVSPTCSPTRAALMTGHFSNRTGVWHTIMGRSILRSDEITLGEIFRRNGYATGMFGKWHLGDNYPCRPEDRGFTEVMRHGGGGVGQTPDYWNNAYFDDTYWHNGKPTKTKGFCTDVWFEYATRFVLQQKKAGKPFFAYISTNAAHGPMHAPKKYSDMFNNLPQQQANFLGMIVNIDDNVGRFRKMLQENGLAESTIFIFTTDNGTAAGAKIFNANMRGRKGSEYEGGHRVPMFIHWPGGKLRQAGDINELCAHVDIAPTLIELCKLKQPANLRFDGTSLASLLKNSSDSKIDWKKRILVTDSQRVKNPIKWRKSAVMQDKYRLINGKELYDLRSDPSQKKNIAAEHPAIVTRLRNHYEQWWKDIEPSFKRDVHLIVGHPAESPSVLTSHDLVARGSTPWNQAQIRNGVSNANLIGPWNIEVHRAGTYEIALRRWPREADAAIDAGLQAAPDVPGVKAMRNRPGKKLNITHAQLTIGNQNFKKAVTSGSKEIVFRAELKKGKTKMTAVFITDEKGKKHAAYYAYVKHIK